MLYLIRHAECLANIEETAMSYSESPLTDDGILQIEYLTDYFKEKKFKEVYSSPISRALLTSTALSTSNHYIATVLSEIALGDKWEGKNWHEIRKEYPFDYHKFLQLDTEFNSEYYESLNKRLEKLSIFFDNYKILEKASNYDIAIVSHGGTLKLLTSLILNKHPKDINWLDNACFSIIEIKNRKPIEYIPMVADHIPLELRGFTKSNWTKYAE